MVLAANVILHGRADPARAGPELDNGSAQRLQPRCGLRGPGTVAVRFLGIARVLGVRYDPGPIPGAGIAPEIESVGIYRPGLPS